MKATGIIMALAATTALSMSAMEPENHSKEKAMTSTGQYTEKQTAYATFGGGCFWCIEAIFSRLNGAHSATSGYAGGHVPNPTYTQVTTGTTGHAEVVQVAYDPGRISYLQLLEVFFRVHDPTTLNRQGADVGTQYRSVIFYHDQEQKQAAEKVKQQLDNEGIWNDPIVTEISKLDTFYRAEEYHQNYFEKNPQQAYCQAVILPKVEKFKSLFRDLLDTPE